MTAATARLAGRLSRPHRRTPRPLARGERLRWWALAILSACGFAFGISAMVVLVSRDGGYAYDAHAYWLAGRNVIEGNALYWPAEVDTFGAYKYPPLFAQLWAPLSLLPALAFSWVWRVACIVSLRWLAGSWRNVGLWLLLPFTVTELSLANVTFPMAAMTVLALRGNASLGVWAAALKVGPAVALPYIWLTRPAARRSMVVGVVTVAGACAVSFAVAPGTWFHYFESLTWQTGSPMDGAGVIALLPTGMADFALRSAVALGLVAIAVRLRSDRLAFVATLIAVPILAIWRFAPLLVLPRLPELTRSATERGASTLRRLRSRSDTPS